jgi:hypothetical protein
MCLQKNVVKAARKMLAPYYRMFCALDFKSPILHAFFQSRFPNSLQPIMPPITIIGKSRLHQLLEKRSKEPSRDR